MYNQVSIKPKKVKNIKLLLISVVSGLLVWTLDAIIDFFLFYPSQSFLDVLIVEVGDFEFYIRSLILLIFIVFGVIIQYSSNKKTSYLERLKISEAQLINKNKEILKAKEKAEESDRLKSAFLANVSHEIRTPMNAIMGLCELLKQESLSQSEKEKYMALVNSSGKRLLTIISDIVDISKIDANQLSLNYEARNLNQLIDNLVVQFSMSRTNKEVLLKTRKALPDDQCFINIDETRITQILSNLIENALKFTKEGEIELGYTLEGGALHFCLKDSGMGMSREDLKLVFDRFIQGENEHSRSGSGTGLGLSIAKGLVQLFKGEIWVESEIDQGSTFHFTIPYLPVEPQLLEPVSKDHDQMNGNGEATILIAEDDDTNFMIIEKLLEKNQYNIIRARNGSEAVELATNNQSVDFVFMDIRMPVMNGLEATQEIRKTNKEIPIVAQTAYAMSEDKIKALEAGCTDFLVKPVTSQMLFDVINKYLEPQP